MSIEGSERMSDCTPLFKADWLWPVFIHFKVDPHALQSHVPFELDLFDDDAYVSLVAFTQARLRPAGFGRTGELLSAPLACHEFLNLRTYVRHGNAVGIYFISEWIPNRLAVLIGPRLYGLPYRLGKLRYCRNVKDRRVLGSVSAAREVLAYRGEYELEEDFEPARDSRSVFLVERYIAWTSCNGVARRFDVAHDPWRVATAHVERVERSLLDRFAPWLGNTTVACAHVSPGAYDVSISAPQTIVKGMLAATNMPPLYDSPKGKMSSSVSCANVSAMRRGRALPGPGAAMTSSNPSLL
jgi:uncharacterized protein YqjF (DUF2071 family)